MDKIEELLTRRVEKIYPSKQTLEKVLRSGKKLKLYQGFDPSTPNLHIGHLVGLLKLKEFQNLGHQVIFLIGDFTGMIGDPTAKKEVRKRLTPEQVKANAETYKKQVEKILNFSGKNPTKIEFNSKWNKKLTHEQVVELMACYTAQQILERDMFQERLIKKRPIFLHELYYPLIQAYDCVAMDVDLELGGTDQTFNMLAGRTLMKALKGKEKFVMTVPILTDASGKKIGKTEGNAINIAQPPEALFAQIMSLPDEAVLPCFELITEVSMEEIEKIKNDLKSGKNPMEYKKSLAFEVTKLCHAEHAAAYALCHFEEVFQKKKVPKKAKSYKLKAKSLNIIDVLVNSKLASSRSEAKRLIKQGAVEINQSTINNQQLTINSGDIIKVGKKRWVRII